MGVLKKMSRLKEGRALQPAELQALPVETTPVRFRP